MKKFITSSIFALMAFSLKSHEQCVNKTGVYFSFNAGVRSALMKQNRVELFKKELSLLEVFIPVLAKSRLPVPLNSFTAEGLVGYQRQIDQVVLGAELGLSHQKMKSNGVAKTYANLISESLEYGYNGFAFEPRFKAGFAFNDTVFYTLFGMTFTPFEGKYDVLLAQNSFKSNARKGHGAFNKSLKGYVLGAGMDHFFSAKIFMSVRYSYTMYDSAFFEVGINKTDSGRIPPPIKFKVKPSDHRVTLGFGYKL